MRTNRENGKAAECANDTSAESAESLTLEETAARLGLAPSTVRLRVAQGYLHPVVARRQGQRGQPRKLFSRAEVDQEAARIDQLNSAHKTIPRTRIARVLRPSFNVSTVAADPPVIFPELPVDGAVAAQAFKLFEGGASPREAVITLSLAPAQAMALWTSYKSLGPEWVLSSKSFAKVRRLLDWDDDPATPENFERALHSHIARQTEREVERELKRRLGGEELSDEEKAQIAELDRELAMAAQRRSSEAEHGRKEVG